jgi:drug/metabolite transporter (DMT)-like permease
LSELRTQTAVHLMPPTATVGESRTVMTAWAGIAASVVAVALIFLGPAHWPALAGALLLACVPVGAAMMCWVDYGDGWC